MNREFKEIIEKLDPLFTQLLSNPVVQASKLPKIMPQKGIYLFSENDQSLYVGRSNHLRERIRLHCRKSSTEKSAAFAFHLARKDTGESQVTYRKEGSRKLLLKNNEFSRAFSMAKEHINKMDLRFIEVKDPIHQAFFEIYAHITLKTPFNDFDNH